MLKKWEELPDFMRIPEVRPYWDKLNQRRLQLFLKRIFDLIIAIVFLFILSLPMLVIAMCIKLDSAGTVMYRQERVTSYGKHFHIHKFCTMVNNADKLGSAVTVDNNNRITKIGIKLRKYRLDELPQVIDVIEGNMSFVGTRPEAVKYVKSYKPEYFATLLMPAGITSEASIRYKNENRLLNDAIDVDRVYLDEVLPAKMKWNLESIESFSILREFLTMIRTVFAVLGRE